MTPSPRTVARVREYNARHKRVGFFARLAGSRLVQYVRRALA